ncbi:MAG: ribonuclease HI [Rickettsiales bacterium]|nr:ribonuclease HI [Rickettsiales bacterium]
MTNKITIYTDGACSGNPGAGGWGAVLLYKEHIKKISGGEKDTTNNRMELKAVIESLRAVKKLTADIIVYTDSKYVQNGIMEWIHGWKKNGWKNAAKKPIKNVDLWMELDEESAKHKIEWKWVKGHSGNKYNEMADELACGAVVR